MANYSEAARTGRQQVQPLSRESARRVAERLESVAARLKVPLDWWAAFLEELLPEAYATRGEPVPTVHPPGSKEKRRELRARARARKPLHHPGDNLAVPVPEGDRPLQISQRGHYKASRAPVLVSRRREGAGGRG